MSKLFLMFSLILIVFVSNSHGEVKPSSPSEIASLAIEHYDSGNCDEAMPLMYELLSNNFPIVAQNPNLEYTLNYYAGYCSKSLGDYERSYIYFLNALRIAKRNQIDDQIAVLYTFLGEVSKELGDYTRAAVYYDYAISIMDINADAIDVATVYYLLAESFRAGKDYKLSLSSCEESEKISSSIKNVKLQIACMTSSGEVYNEIGDYPQAIKRFNDGLVMARLSHLPVEMGNNHFGLALVYDKMGTYDLAKQNYDEALRFYSISSEMVNVPFIIEKLINLPVNITSKQAEKSIANYLGSVAYMLAEPDTTIILDMYILIGIYYEYAVDFDAAKLNYENVYKLSCDIGDDKRAFKSLMMLVDLYEKANQSKEAISILSHSKTCFKDNSVFLGAIIDRLAGLSSGVQD